MAMKRSTRPPSPPCVTCGRTPRVHTQPNEFIVAKMGRHQYTIFRREDSGEYHRIPQIGRRSMANINRMLTAIRGPSGWLGRSIVRVLSLMDGLTLVEIQAKVGVRPGSVHGLYNALRILERQGFVEQSDPTRPRRGCRWQLTTIARVGREVSLEAQMARNQRPRG